MEDDHRACSLVRPDPQPLCLSDTLSRSHSCCLALTASQGSRHTLCPAHCCLCAVVYQAATPRSYRRPPPLRRPYSTHLVHSTHCCTVGPCISIRTFLHFTQERTKICKRQLERLGRVRAPASGRLCRAYQHRTRRVLSPMVQARKEKIIRLSLRTSSEIPTSSLPFSPTRSPPSLHLSIIRNPLRLTP